MSFLKSVKVDKSAAGEQDRLPNSVMESGSYMATIKGAYGDESKNGAKCIVFEFSINGQPYRETLYITNREGSTSYKDKQNKSYLLPGFIHADNICYFATGNSIMEQETENKLVKIYDYETQQNKEVTRDVFVDLIGKKVMLGIRQIKDYKNELIDGKYVPIDDIRESNQIDKVFNEDGFTREEKQEGKAQPEFITKWEDTYKGKVWDKTKKKKPVKGGKSGSILNKEDSAEDSDDDGMPF